MPTGSIEVVTPVRGARLGLVTGAVLVGGILSWVWIFGWYAWLALTAVDSLWFALFGAGAVMLLRRAPAALKPPVLAAAWTVVEWLRSLGGLGLTWGDLAVSQHRTLPMLQMLDWTGPYGLTFLIALVNASLAAVALELWSGRRLKTSVRSSPTGGRWLAGAALLAALLAARGAWVLAQ